MKETKQEEKVVKEYLKQKIQEIKDRYKIKELKEIGGESKVLDVGDFISGEYLGEEKVLDKDDNEVDLILLKTDEGVYSIRKSYEISLSVKAIEKGKRIVVLCYDKIDLDGGRLFKKFKVWEVIA